MRVGFIGLGALGFPMARHVAARHETVVWNRTRARSELFASVAGASVADSPAALARELEVLVTCLPTSREVAGIVDAIGGAWRAGQVLLDATSGDPAASRELAQRLASRGVGFLDAPVSGGVAGAERGRLTVMVGGEARLLERVRPLLSCYAATIIHCGPVGSGHAVKALNNVLLAVNIAAAGEVLVALAKLGVPVRVALDVVNASSGRSNVTENLIPERVLTRAWPRTFRLALLDKDVRIALGVLQQASVPAPVAEATARFFGEAHRVLGEAADHVEAIKVIEQAAGVEVR